MCGFTSGLSILFHWSIFLSLWSQALSLQSLQWSQWTGRWVLLCPFYYESQRMEVTFLGWSAIKLQDWDSSLTILTAKLTIIHYLLMPNWLLPSLFSSVQSLSRVRLFVTPWITAHQTSLSITNSQSLLKLISIESVMPSSHLILCHPLSSCSQSLPASESSPMSQLFTWGGQSIGVSALASFLPMNTKDWSPSEWTCLIPLQSKGLSRVFSNTTVQKHQFFGAQFSSQSNSHIHTWPQEIP